MGWNIEGIDMSTAFLQTLPTEKRLWTSGVRKLREALQIPEDGIMRDPQKLLWIHNCSLQPLG